jgi:hypothetical protein
MQVKQVVHTLDPIFEAHPVLSENYQTMTYTSLKDVTINQVNDAIASFGVQLIEFIIKEDE